ncbi:hypothetical protein F4679DRAFT_545493 [Xylaria curta]|nr:hypothetical protein F4679DRAFT_545493 [Xylaria curta]
MAKREDVQEELTLCVSQDSPGNSQRSPSTSHFELDDLIGTVLGQEFEIGEQLRDEKNNNNHFITFAVRQHDAKSATADNTNELVARIYNMNDLTPKHKRYKIRSINRSAARTLFKTTWNSCQIIILKLGPLDHFGSSTDTATSLDIASLKLKTNVKHSHSTLGIAKSGVVSANSDLPLKSNITSPEQKVKAKMKTKTNHQRESSRLRQRNRRATKRRQQRLIAISSRTKLDPRSLSEIIASKRNSFDDETFTMIVMLYFDFDIPAEFEMQLPPEKRLATRMYNLMRSASKFPVLSLDEKPDFLQLKENELAYLLRLKAQLHGSLQRCFHEILDLPEQQRLAIKESAQQRHLQMHFLDPKERWYMVLLSASTILSRLITESEALICSFKKDIKKDEEGKRIYHGRRWIFRVIPGSDTCNLQATFTLLKAVHLGGICLKSTIDGISDETC